MAPKALMLGALISLLTGCKPTPPPTKPGVSIPLKFPVLLVSDRSLKVYDNEDSLITTTTASGMGYPAYQVIASDGMTYSILKETQFGRSACFMDMGTKPFQVFLQLKKTGAIPLPKAKALVLTTALAPHGEADGTAHGAEIATQRIQASASLTDLIEVCRKTSDWR